MMPSAAFHGMVTICHPPAGARYRSMTRGQARMPAAITATARTVCENSSARAIARARKGSTGIRNLAPMFCGYGSRKMKAASRHWRPTLLRRLNRASGARRNSGPIWPPSSPVTVTIRNSGLQRGKRVVTEVMSIAFFERTRECKGSGRALLKKGDTGLSSQR